MADLPDDVAYLERLIERAAVLPEPGLRQHWRTLVPWLDVSERYELAAILVAVEQALRPGAA